MGDTAIASVRHLPRQDRSTLRYELILDTTAALIDEVGYPAITMTLLAKRADMSGPGLYRYFDDLTAIARALAERNLTRFLDATGVILAAPDLPWEDAMAAMVSVYVEMYRNEPGFRWLRLGDPVSRTLIDSSTSNKSIVARHTAEMFIARYDVDDRADLLEHVETIVEISDALLAKAFESDPAGNPFFIAETSRVISGYLAEYLARPIPEH